MLKRFFDPKLVYRVVVYLRMSSDQQNKRSPDQQLAEIKRVLKSLGYHWIIVEIFRDDAKTGRLLRNRKDYQRMMQGIKTGAIKVDLILVDTSERFGRVEELPTIRKELYEKHGVLVLTADTGFADPNTPQGKAMGMVEAMRATEHGRILGHNVLRGKRDAAEQGHWPGGPPPFGLKLENVMKDVKGRQEVDYSILVHNPETNWIMKLLLDKAYETSWGQTRLGPLPQRSSGHSRQVQAVPGAERRLLARQPDLLGRTALGAELHRHRRRHARRRAQPAGGHDPRAELLPADRFPRAAGGDLGGSPHPARGHLGGPGPGRS